MDRVYYDFISVHIMELKETIRDINDCQDRIVAVTQSGDYYTIFYQSRGNSEEDKK